MEECASPLVSKMRESFSCVIDQALFYHCFLRSQELIIPKTLLIGNPCDDGCRLEKHVKAAEAREEQERAARLEEAQAAAKRAKEYQAELEHRLQIQVGG